jgi:chromosome segregation ATPase
MKWTNPLHNPAAVFLGCVILVLGVRLGKVSSVIVVPVAIAMSTLSASLLKPAALKPSAARPVLNSALETELTAMRQQAQTLAQKAQKLSAEANQILSTSPYLDLLGTVQFACERTGELPAKIDALALRLQGEDSILSVGELQNQLREVQDKLKTNPGEAAQAQLQKLADSLKRNIELTQQGQDARQAQVLSLSTLISESAGVLQTMKNQLRSLDLADTTQADQLQSLSNELRDFQENLDLLVVR